MAGRWILTFTVWVANISFHLTGASTQTSLCVQRDPLQYETDFNGGPPHPAQCRSLCQTAGKEFYGLSGKASNRTSCFCGDDIPPPCPETCSQTCYGVPCGGTCATCTPPICVSAYTVTPSAYPKCTSAGSWTEIPSYPGGTNGFPIAVAVESCQEACRTGPHVTGTFSAVMRNGAGRYARCYCGDEDHGDTAGRCTLTCGGQPCGGPGDYRNTYPACIEGTYGQTCESDCRVSCPDNVCDVTYGFCPLTCPVGTYGIFCNRTCPQNCDSNECQSYSGECSKGCKYGHFGSKCEFNCSSTCLNSRCDQDTSVCSGCISGIYGDNCTDTCANCVGGCAQSGDGACDAGGCKLGYHGDYCNKNCSESCLNRQCEQDTAVCVGCVSGKYGDQCTSECFCVSDCNQDSGICNPGGCIDGYFSQKCDQNCSTTCLNRKCDQFSARCEGCEKDYYGDNCTQQCLNCGNSCNQTGGHCIDGCKDGHYTLTCDQNCSLSCEAKRCDIMSGNCTLGCQDDIYYGSWCNKNCSQNCIASQCDRDNGHCYSCVTGQYKLECDTPCPRNCRGDQCERMFGNCTNGCKDGWQGDTCIELKDKTNPKSIWLPIVTFILGAVLASLSTWLIINRRKQRIPESKPNVTGQPYENVSDVLNSHGQINNGMNKDNPDEMHQQVASTDGQYEDIPAAVVEDTRAPMNKTDHPEYEQPHPYHNADNFKGNEYDKLKWQN